MSIPLFSPLRHLAKKRFLLATLAIALTTAAPVVASNEDFDPDAEPNTPVLRSAWNGEGDGKRWDDAANWSPNGIPGSSGNKVTDVLIASTRDTLPEVTLKSDITRGDLGVLTINNGSTLTIDSGATLGNLRLGVDSISSGDSVVTMNGGTWSQEAGGYPLVIGRILNPDYSDRTSKFVMNGGSYQSSNPGSSGRMDIGHGDNLGTAIFEMNGGDFFMTGSINLSGGETGNSHLKFTGGTVTVNGLNLNLSTVDGFNCLVEVTGSKATIEAGAVNLQKNEANTSGKAVTRFIFDNKGVSKISASSLNLGEGSSAGTLEVDVSQIAGNGTTGYVLFEFDKMEGSFGEVQVRSGETVLKEGKEGSLRMNEYALSSGKSGVFIKLFFKSQRPPAQMGAKPMMRR